MRAAFAAAAAALLAGSLPARADALLDAIRAEAAALKPGRFERTRTIRDTREGNAPRVEVDRFDPHAPAGRQWVLLSVNGRPPTDEDRRAHARFVADQRIVPGAWRLDPLLAGPDPSIRKAGGATIYSWPRLPKGALPLSRFDLTAHLAAEATVTEVGGRPTVTNLRIYAPRPFRVLAIARIDRMTVVSEYERGSEGALRLTRQTTEQTGTIPGRGSGTTHTEMTFRPLEPVAAARG
ncbi:hypothetical protein [Thermaurantiacus sp.]